MSAPLPEMGLHLSEMERRATDAERELVEWKKVRFMADKLGEVFSGYVTGVQAFGLFVELDEIYVQGLVHVSSMTDDYYRFDEKAHLLKGENTGKVYRLGDGSRCRWPRSSWSSAKIDFALVDVLERAKAGRGPGRPRAPDRASRPAGGGRGRERGREAHPGARPRAADGAAAGADPPPPAGVAQEHMTPGEGLRYDAGLRQANRASAGVARGPAVGRTERWCPTSAALPSTSTARS